jgi:hypothetical protein
VEDYEAESMTSKSRTKRNAKSFVTVLYITLALLGPKAAAIQSSSQSRAEAANATLKDDMTDLPGDSRRVLKNRKSLRKAYDAYVSAFQKYGHGNSRSAGAAKKVMRLQNDLHRQIEKEVSTKEQASHPAIAAEKNEGAKNEENLNIDKGGFKDESPAEGSAWSYYDEVVKEYGADSPQAQAVKRQMEINP